MGLPTLWPGHTLCALATPPAFDPPTTLAPVSCSIFSSFTRRPTQTSSSCKTLVPTQSASVHHWPLHLPLLPPLCVFRCPRQKRQRLCSIDCACTALAPGLRCRDLRSFSLSSPSPPRRRTRRRTQQNNERLRQTTRIAPLFFLLSSFVSHPSNSLPHPSHRPACPPAWFDPPPSEPAAPVCAAARARPSACTKTGARPAKTAQKACTSAICPRRAWPITTARAQRAIPQRIAQRATLCRRPGPVPLTPGSPLWAQAEPDTYRRRPKSECFCFLCLLAPTPSVLDACCLFVCRHPSPRCFSLSLMPCLSDCSVCLQPCKSREHPSEPLHPVWAQRRHVPPLSSVQPPPSPRFLSPNGPAALVAPTRAAAVRRAMLPPSARFPSIPPLHSPISVRMPGGPFFSPTFLPFFFLFAAAVCALVAAARSLKPPEPERNSLT